MARDSTDNRPIESRRQLVEWMEAGCKPKADWRIGTEHEKFGFNLADNSPVAYEGERGIGALLDHLQSKTGWEPILDEGRIIGLVDTDGGGAISLEPGGQFELSGAPVETIHQTCAESNTHLALVKELAAELGVGFLGVGASPAWRFDETPRMPKSRYDIMTAYMPKVGSRGHDMMYRTATIQVNLDFDSEADMRRKVQVALKLQPLASALFANSPFTEGRPNGMLSWRSQIWHDVDNQRGGYHPFMLEDDFGFERYVDWALDIPMYFVIRDGKYHDCTHITFRQFMEGAMHGEIDDGEPNVGDWNNHLTTLFPDVRVKRFIEMRGADGGPWRRICALPALWTGLLYHEDSLADAEALTRDWTAAMVGELRAAVPVEGLAAQIDGRLAISIARDVLGLSQAGLRARGLLNSEGDDESLYLEPLMETVASGMTPAEQLLQGYYGAWDRDINRLFEEHAF